MFLALCVLEIFIFPPRQNVATINSRLSDRDRRKVRRECTKVGAQSAATPLEYVASATKCIISRAKLYPPRECAMDVNELSTSRGLITRDTSVQSLGNSQFARFTIVSINFAMICRSFCSRSSTSVSTVLIQESIISSFVQWTRDNYEYSYPEARTRDIVPSTALSKLLIKRNIGMSAAAITANRFKIHSENTLKEISLQQIADEFGQTAVRNFSNYVKMSLCQFTDVRNAVQSRRMNHR